MGPAAAGSRCSWLQCCWMSLYFMFSQGVFVASCIGGRRQGSWGNRYYRVTDTKEGQRQCLATGEYCRHGEIAYLQDHFADDYCWA